MSEATATSKRSKKKNGNGKKPFHITETVEKELLDHVVIQSSEEAPSLEELNETLAGLEDKALDHELIQLRDDLDSLDFRYKILARQYDREVKAHTRAKKYLSRFHAYLRRIQNAPLSDSCRQKIDKIWEEELKGMACSDE